MRCHWRMHTAIALLLASPCLASFRLRRRRASARMCTARLRRPPIQAAGRTLPIARAPPPPQGLSAVVAASAVAATAVTAKAAVAVVAVVAATAVVATAVVATAAVAASLPVAIAELGWRVWAPALGTTVSFEAGLSVFSLGGKFVCLSPPSSIPN